MATMARCQESCSAEPSPLYGRIRVGRVIASIRNRKIAGMRFDPADERKGAWAERRRLLIDPVYEGSGHSLCICRRAASRRTSRSRRSLTWTGSSVIPTVDRTGPMLDGACAPRKQIVLSDPRRDDTKAAGHRGSKRAAWIEIPTRGELHVRSVGLDLRRAATSPVGRGEDPFFGRWARAGHLTCCTLVWSDPSGRKISLARSPPGSRFPEDDMRAVAGISAASRSRMEKRIAGTLIEGQGGRRSSAASI